jgi:hypothetical protein
MNHQVKKHIATRVADYFTLLDASNDLICSRDDGCCKGTSFRNLKFKAHVTSRYPINDHPHDPLPDGLPLFCFPNGIEIVDNSRIPLFHTFVLTSEEGNRMLGCCLTVHEPLNAAQLNSYRQIIISQPDIGDTDVDQLLSRPLFLPRCMCLISNWTFVSSFKKYLCSLYQLTLVPCSIPFERYVCNFIDDVPSPPPGRVAVTYFMGEQSITFRCPPSNHPNVWSGLPLFPLFECLSPDNVLALFAAVLTERQILFISSQYGLLTCCAEAITSLIYPLSWTHAYIPILPTILMGS